MVVITKGTSDTNEGWNEFEQEIRNEIINSKTFHFSTDNDITGESMYSSGDLNVNSSIDLTDSPCQKLIDLCANHDNDEIVQGNSPLQMLHSEGQHESTSFENEILRSPMSMSIELEPFQCIYNEKYCEEYGCSSSPLSSRLLDMISTPKTDTDGVIPRRYKHHQRETRHRKYDQQSRFKSRPAENGVFVMNQRCVPTPAFSSSSHHIYKQSLSRDTKKLKRKRSSDGQLSKSNSTISSERKLETDPVNNDIIGCRCTKTKCLKLYCDCFQAGTVCKDHCDCSECKNIPEESGPNGLRTRVIKSILKRRPNAFQRKTRDPDASCACKSSKCLKKYCQCFLQGRDCYERCTCQDCHNNGLEADDDEDKALKHHRIWNDDDSVNSISQSASFEKMDRIIGCPPSTSNHLSMMVTKEKQDPKPFTYTNTSTTSRIPPPCIPDIFKTSISALPLPGSIPPPGIPDVFRNATSSASVPPDVFSNPNYWLPWASSGSSSTATGNRNPSSLKLSKEES